MVVRQAVFIKKPLKATCQKATTVFWQFLPAVLRKSSAAFDEWRFGWMNGPDFCVGWNPVGNGDPWYYAMFFFLGVVWCRMSRHTHAYWLLWWWFPIFFMFTPSWGRFPFWQSYLSNGLVRSPTRYRWLYQAMFYITTLCCYVHHPGLSRPPPRKHPPCTQW